MQQAQRIRRLAAQQLTVEVIASRLGLRPAVVRRVLGRSAQRGAPRKRPASVILSFVTTPDVARRLRAMARAGGMPLSSALDELVRRALPDGPDSRGTRIPAPGRARAPSLRKASGRPSQRLRSEKLSSDAQEEHGTGQPPATAAAAPPCVRALLKSYDLRALRWRVARHRYEIVLAILTRGDEDARRWLSTVLPRDEVRTLVRKFAGAGCSEPDRRLLREELDLSEREIPVRPYLGFDADPPQ